MKFARGPHAKVSPVNDVDVGVYQLMQSEQLLSRKVESLSQEAVRYKEEARRACRAGKKQLALRSLKAKQRTEKRIEALHAKLDTVQGILDRIYASQTDQMVAPAPLFQYLASPPGIHRLSPPLWLCCLEEARFLSGRSWDCLCLFCWDALASVDMG